MVFCFSGNLDYFDSCRILVRSSSISRPSTKAVSIPIENIGFETKNESAFISAKILKRDEGRGGQEKRPEWGKCPARVVFCSPKKRFARLVISISIKNQFILR